MIFKPAWIEDEQAWKDQVAKEIARWKEHSSYIPVIPLPMRIITAEQAAKLKQVTEDALTVGPTEEKPFFSKVAPITDNKYQDTGKRVRYSRTGEEGVVVRDSQDPNLVFVRYDSDKHNPKATRREDLVFL